MIRREIVKLVERALGLRDEIPALVREALRLRKELVEQEKAFFDDISVLTGEITKIVQDSRAMLDIPSDDDSIDTFLLDIHVLAERHRLQKRTLETMRVFLVRAAKELPDLAADAKREGLI
jgi:hypothetical protein